MSNLELITETNDGSFSIMLANSTCLILKYILDPEVPYVWIIDHQPDPYLRWMSYSVPLNAEGEDHQLEVRRVVFDIQMTTGRFLEILPKFEDYGIHLIQSTEKMPDSLVLHHLKEGEQTKVLIQNGFHLRFLLPHARESAMLQSAKREVIENVLEIPEVLRNAYR